MSRSSRRLAALAAVVAVLGVGCTNQDVDGSDAASVLEDAGAPEAVQTCVGDAFDDELNQDQLNEVGGADDLSDLDAELGETVDRILDECVASDGESAGEGEGDSETTESTEADGEGDGEGEPTDTTAADATTTTTAPA